MKKVACISLSIDELTHIRSLINPKEDLELFRKINDPIALLSVPIDKDNFLNEALKMGWVQCGIEYKSPYRESDHGSFPEKLKSELKKSKRIILNVIEDHKTICECLESENVKFISFK